MTEIKLASRKRSASLNLHPDWKKCLCPVAESSGKLTLFTEKNWERFEKCSLRRNDHIWLKMMNHWRGGPKGGYHRQCYQRYTDVGNISRIEETVNKAAPASAYQEIAADEPSTEPPAKRFHRSHVQRFEIDKYIICQVEKFKSGKGARSIEALIQNISEYGTASLLRAADVRGDNRVLPQIKGQECIAREIKYYRSCYKNYVRLETLTKLEAQNCATEDKKKGATAKHLANCVIIFKVKT